MKNPHYCTQRNIWNILIYIYIYIYVFINTESSQLFDFDNSVLSHQYFSNTHLSKYNFTCRDYAFEMNGHKVLKTMEYFLSACCDIIRAATNKIWNGIIFDNQPGHNCISC